MLFHNFNDYSKMWSKTKLLNSSTKYYYDGSEEYRLEHKHRAVMACSLLSSLQTNHDAVFWIICKGLITHAGRPAGRAFHLINVEIFPIVLIIPLKVRGRQEKIKPFPLILETTFNK